MVVCLDAFRRGCVLFDTFKHCGRYPFQNSLLRRYAVLHSECGLLYHRMSLENDECGLVYHFTELELLKSYLAASNAQNR